MFIVTLQAYTGKYMEEKLMYLITFAKKNIYYACSLSHPNLKLSWTREQKNACHFSERS